MSTLTDRPPRRGRHTSLLWLSGLVALTALLLVLVLLPLARASSTGRGSLVGKPAPILEADDLAGKRWTMSAGEGRLIWINFWATWCPPCRTEMPMMQRLAEAYGDRLLILGVDYGEEPGAVRDFVDRYGITYPILLDPTLENFFRWSPVFGLPRHYFVDSSGTVVYEVSGELPADQMAGVLEELIGPIEPTD